MVDQSNAVIPNASVTIKNKATGAERKVSSDNDGNFSAPALQAGVYEVNVQAKGFRTSLREPVSVQIHRVDGQFQEERTYPRNADPPRSPG